MAIVTCTLNPALDVSLRVERVEPERKLRCDVPRRDPGGGGLNVSRVIAELGGHSTAVYPAGGHTGAELSEQLSHACGERLEPAQIDIATPTRENFTVLEHADNRQFRFNTPGATLSEHELDQCLEAVDSRLSEGDLLVVSGSLPPEVSPDAYRRLAEIAQRCAAKLIGDSSGEALRALCAAGAFLLKPNVRELGALLDRDLSDGDSIAESAGQLIEAENVDVVVVSMAEKGAVLVTGDVRLRAASPSVEQRSRIGAGDSMVGAMTLAISRGNAWSDVLRRGVAAGCAAVMTPGTELLHGRDFETLAQEVTVEEV